MRKVKLLALLIVSMVWCSVRVWAEEEEGWKPDEPFFVEHEAECILENREYYANGPNGEVVIYESPASSKVVKILKQGKIVLIDYIFTNEKQIAWGLCEVEGEFGWLPMPYMVNVYDNIDFEEEYVEQIQDKRGASVVEDDGTFYKSSRQIRFWRYPGSERKYTVRLPRGNDYIPDYTKIFIDEEGRTWGFVSYYQGKKPNCWICINSVEELVADFAELYPNGAPERDKRVIEPYAGEEIFPDDYEKMQKIEKIKSVSIGVGIVVITGITLLFCWNILKKVKEA